MTRPETRDNGPAYGQQLGDGLHKEFTPWVPSDPSTAGEAPTWETAAHGPTEKEEADESEPTRGGRWWTEDNPRKLATGDRIHATIEFDNGYTEEVRTEHLERRGWLD